MRCATGATSRNKLSRFTSSSGAITVTPVKLPPGRAQLSAIPADVFAGPHLGTILGVVQAGGGLGGAIGPFLGGWLFDVTGSYGLAFLTAAGAVAGSGVAAWFAARPMERAPDAD